MRSSSDADVRQRRCAGAHNVRGSGLDEVQGQRLLHRLQRIVKDELLRSLRMRALHGLIAAAQDADVLADVADVQQLGLDAVVEVGGEVGDLVGEVDNLGLERRLLPEKEIGELGVRVRVVVARVLHDALARGQGEVQAAVPGVALLKALHDAQRMQVVVKAQAVRLQAAVERALAGVAEGRMADVMHQRKGLGEIDVEAER
jgi:hypothetical protein